MREDSKSNSISVEIVSPEKLLLSAEATQAIVPGTEGEFGVLPGHSPLLSSLRPGVIRVELSGQPEPKRFFIRGGFADVTPRQCTLLVEAAWDLSETPREQLEAQLELTRQEIASLHLENSSPEALQMAQFRLFALQDILAGNQ